MSKEKFNKIRVIICYIMTAIIILTWVCYIIMCIMKTEKVVENTNIGKLFLILNFIVAPIYCFLVFYKFKKYGGIRFNSWYTTPTIIKYYDFKTTDLKNKLKKNKYKIEKCNISGIDGEYYLKMSPEKDIHLFVFLKLKEITEELYIDYKKNNLITFQDKIGNEEGNIIEGWRYFYIYLILDIEEENKYSKELETYNKTTIGELIFMPIIIKKATKRISIPTYNDGMGQILYKRQKAKIVKYLREMINVPEEEQETEALNHGKKKKIN